MEEAPGGAKGSGEVFEAELQHVSALAACAANMRVFDEGKWKSDVGYLETWIFHGFFMDFYGFLMDVEWMFNGFMDFSLILMDFHGFLNGYSWILMDLEFGGTVYGYYWILHG